MARASFKREMREFKRRSDRAEANRLAKEMLPFGGDGATTSVVVNFVLAQQQESAAAARREKRRMKHWVSV